MSGLLFFLIVGRIAFDSFRELFVEFFYLVTFMGLLNLWFNYRETETQQVKVFVVVVLSILCTGYVLMQFHVA